MRIGIDARKLHDFGIGTYIRNLLQELARMDHETEFVILSRPDDSVAVTTLGENFRVVKETAGNYSLAEQVKIPLDLRRERVDLFHAPHYVLPPLVRCPSVVTIHDCIHLMFPQYLPNRWSLAYARTSITLAAKRSTRVLTVSESSKRDILRYVDIPPGKIDVIYNAYDERFRDVPNEEAVARVRERFQLQDQFVLYAGNVKPHKNLERLIEAFHLVRSRGLDHLKLVLIGDEISKYTALRRAVHRHQLHKYVRFLGFLPLDTLAVLYRLAGVFVFPSLYEGFGLPPLEAMASGTPVVTSNVSSLPEVAGNAAVLVDPYNASAIADGIYRVLTDDVAPHGSEAPGNRTRDAVFVGVVGPPRARDLRSDRTVSAATGKKIALVHDWLTGMRGGEKVLEAVCERYPEAELFTLVHIKGSVSPTIERLRPQTSFIQRLPMVRRAYRAYLPLFPTAIEQFDLDRFDLVVSLSHCCAKSIVRTGRARHLCYCLTPMRYAWDQFDAYFGPDRLGRVPSAIMRRFMSRMARWDRATAGRADRYVAISHYVAGRIRRYYNRDATVVYPPVDTTFFTPLSAASRTPSPASLLFRLLGALRARRLGTGAVQARGPRHRRLPAREHAPEDRRRRPGARAARTGRRRGSRQRDVPRTAARRGDSRPVPRSHGHTAAGRRGLRHRARRGASMRYAGRRPQSRRRG